MSSLLMRLLLAVVLVVNGTGSALASAGESQRVAVEAGAPPAMAGCHEAAEEAAPAAMSGDTAPAAHGHCCHDACHCVCALQAHPVATLPAPVPARTVAVRPALPGWAAPDPALLLRPPIA